MVSLRDWLRRGLGLGAFVVLWNSLWGGGLVPELRTRLATLRDNAHRDARARHLAGMAGFFDRRFVAFVLAAGDAMPRDVHGVVLDAPQIPNWGGGFWAIYHFAPIPTVRDSPTVPPGWIVAAYGPSHRPGLRVVRELPGGALLAAPR